MKTYQSKRQVTAARITGFHQGDAVLAGGTRKNPHIFKIDNGYAATYAPAVGDYITDKGELIKQAVFEGEFEEVKAKTQKAPKKT